MAGAHGGSSARMYPCHIFEHEQLGMMGTVDVQV